jgi:hypothetical protein
MFIDDRPIQPEIKARPRLVKWRLRGLRPGRHRRADGIASSRGLSIPRVFRRPNGRELRGDFYPQSIIDRIDPKPPYRCRFVQ